MENKLRGDQLLTASIKENINSAKMLYTSLNQMFEHANGTNKKEIKKEIEDCNNLISELSTTQVIIPEKSDNDEENLFEIPIETDAVDSFKNLLTAIDDYKEEMKGENGYVELSEEPFDIIFPAELNIPSSIILSYAFDKELADMVSVRFKNVFFTKSKMTTKEKLEHLHDKTFDFSVNVYDRSNNFLFERVYKDCQINYVRYDTPFEVWGHISFKGVSNISE